MNLALYHPEQGYYAKDRPRTGWSGDFVTSPELDPAFGALWAVGLEQVWEACGSPSDFEVVEVGAGESGLARSVLTNVRDDFADALRYTIVERNEAVRRRQHEHLRDQARVVWVASLSELGPTSGRCIIANEVLDNFPVRIYERHAEHLLEVYVDFADGELREVLCPPESDPIADLDPRAVPEGGRLEIAPDVDAFIATVARVLTKGALVLIDYGLGEPELLQHPRGTVVAYSAEGASEAVLEAPGERDITAHVNWDRVRRALVAHDFQAAGPYSQRDVLSSLGAGELDLELRAEYNSAVAARDGSRAVRALSRRQALGALRDASGLGALEVIVAVRAIPVPPFANVK